MTIQTYACVHLGSVPTRMFTLGKNYRHVEGHGQPAVIDDLGCVRVIGHSLNFITNNSCTNFPPGGFMSRAYFEAGPLLLTPHDWGHISRCAAARGHIASLDGGASDRAGRELRAAAYLWGACYCSPPLSTLGR